MIRFIREEEGANLVEYALLTGFVALGAMAVLAGMGGSITAVYQKIKTSVEAVAVP